MKTITLIPARGGSKGIPRKNVRLIGGKPLLGWTIDAARAAGLEHIIVSTDDDEIADVARAHGAEVPFMRPAELATDEASSLDVVLHALDAIAEPFDAVLLLQPTSPLRTVEDIAGVLDMAGETDAPSVVSVTPAPSHPDWMYRLTGDAKLERLTSGIRPSRRQLLDPVFVANGAIYYAKPEWLKDTCDFTGPGTLGFVMPAERSVDLDTMIDWQFAELLLNGRRTID